jgi:hypothetical protein
MKKPAKQDEFPALRRPRLSLKIGEWKKLFQDEEYKLIIAQALNYCVYEKPRKYHVERNEPGYTFLFTRLYITGYLITRQMVHLVLDSEEQLTSEEQENIFRELTESLNLKIEEAIERMRGRDNLMVPGINIAEDQEEEDDEDELPAIAMPFRHLIQAPPLTNYLLVKLITGSKVELPYYSIQLARLKDSIRNYPFCSAIDYGGAKGPVLITKPGTIIGK